METLELNTIETIKDIKIDNDTKELQVEYDNYQQLLWLIQEKFK